MPGFDGTGPAGQGPMTGGGFGPCGSGMAMRRGRGGGMGMGRRRNFGAAPQQTAPTSQDRVDALEDRLSRIETLLEELAQAEK